MELATNGHYPPSSYMADTYGAEIQQTPVEQPEEFSPEKMIWGYKPQPFSMEEARRDYEMEAGQNEALSRKARKEMPPGVIWGAPFNGINCNTDPSSLDTEQLKYYLITCKGKRREDVDGASRRRLLSML